jgi:hypothetical protein
MSGRASNFGLLNSNYIRGNRGRKIRRLGYTDTTRTCCQIDQIVSGREKRELGGKSTAGNQGNEV